MHFPVSAMNSQPLGPHTSPLQTCQFITITTCTCTFCQYLDQSFTPGSNLSFPQILSTQTPAIHQIAFMDSSDLRLNGFRFSFSFRFFSVTCRRPSCKWFSLRSAFKHTLHQLEIIHAFGTGLHGKKFINFLGF